MATEERVTARPDRRPAHPGAILRRRVLPAVEAQGVAKAELARRLGIKRQTLYDLLNEKRAVTPDTAARLARCVGGSSAFWLNLQMQYELWEAERNPALANIEKIDFPTAA